jgi:hypothetical protein
MRFKNFNQKTGDSELGCVENEIPYTFVSNQLTPKRLTIINCGQKSE